MKYVVGYNGSPSSRRALSIACEQAKLTGALIYVVMSLEGGPAETPKEIREANEKLSSVKEFISKLGVQYETFQLVRGLSPGEDLVKFAQDNAIDHIFLGIEKKSRTSKIILGSTAQYIILKGPCPVTTTK